MSNPARPVVFILAATDHGTMIINRHDYNMLSADQGYGVGFMLLNQSSCEMSEAGMVKSLIDFRRRHFGDDVMVVDCGANIGVFSVEWARHMTGWGRVIAIEAQEQIFYALAGNISINNCFNARLINAAVSARPGVMKIPQPNYSVPSSFGSLELRQRPGTEDIGQVIDYSEENMASVRTISIDSLGLRRLDVMKIDVEGMEAEVLEGAANTIADSRPILLIETVKSDMTVIGGFLSRHGYKSFNAGANIVAIHTADPCLEQVRQA